jgi:hypothetical protein
LECLPVTFQGKITNQKVGKNKTKVRAKVSIPLQYCA